MGNGLPGTVNRQRTGIRSVLDRAYLNRESVRTCPPENLGTWNYTLLRGVIMAPSACCLKQLLRKVDFGGRASVLRFWIGPGIRVTRSCRNIPYQDTLRDVTGYRHCRFFVKSLTQTAIDSIVDSLVLLFVVDFRLRKISFQLL